jgi:hypothetical protein
LLKGVGINIYDFVLLLLYISLTTMWRDTSGEDIAETETEDSSEFDSEGDYDEDFIDDSDLEIYPTSPIPNSGGILRLL